MNKSKVLFDACQVAYEYLVTMGDSNEVQDEVVATLQRAMEEYVNE